MRGKRALGAAMATLFISDLHLCPSRPDGTRLFLDFLAGPARAADTLYILGDLFEYWAGDDDLDDPFNREICVALRAATDARIPVCFMAGNRDFLIGEAFARATGIRLLPDPAHIDVAGVATLLMHGDTLCTDDLAYQSFRSEVRSDEWQQAFLALPLAVRKARIEALRRESEEKKREKPADITDVSPAAVASALQAHGCPRLIHGHTHRPGRHRFLAGGRECERWVLPAWYEGGGYLACRREGWGLCDWPA